MQMYFFGLNSKCNNFHCVIEYKNFAVVELMFSINIVGILNQF